MRPRTLLILFILVVGLGAFVWFFERELPTSEERAEEAKKVLHLEAGDVEAVVVDSPAGTLRLEVEEGPADEGGGAGEGGEASSFADRHWRLTEPLAAAADDSLVQSLLGTLEGLEKQRTLEDYDADELGLTDPRATVTLATRSGETRLRVGAQIPASDSMVVAVEGREEAYVVASTLFTDLEREPGAWRDRSIFRGERADIQSIRLSPAAGEALLLARRGEEYWLETPLSDRADRDKSNRLVSDLVGLEATTFVDDPAADPAALGLEPPAGVVEVVLAGREEPFRLELGGEVSEGSLARYARAGGQLFETEADLAHWLGQPAAEWRSPAWSSLESWEVDAAKVEDAQGTLSLERSGTDWKRDGEKIPYTPVSDLFFALTDANAASFAEEGEAPRGEPLVTVTLTGSGGQEEVLTLYPASGEVYPARASGRQVTLQLAADDVKEVRDKLAALRAAEPLPADEGADEGSGGGDGIEVEAEEGDSPS